MKPASPRPPLRNSAYGLRTLIIFSVGWVSVVVLEIAEQSVLIADLTESSLRLAIWSCLMGLLVYYSWRAFPWAGVRYSVLFFAACSTVAFGLGVTKDIRALDYTPLIGLDGAANHLVKKALFAGWACGIGYLFFSLLRSLDQSQDELEQRVVDRTAELTESNRRLQEDIAQRKQAEAALRRTHDELEQRVAERTRKLSQAIARLEQEIEQRKRSQETLQAIVEGTSAVTGEEFFPSLARELAHHLHVHSLAVCEALSPNRVRTLAFWVDEGFEDNVEFEVDGSPCAEAAAGAVTHYPRGVRQQFPGDPMLGEMGIESYCGIPMRDSTGSIIGHLGLMHDAPLEHNLCDQPIVQFFAARAAVELERKRAEEALRKSEQRLQTLITAAPVVLTSIRQDHVIDLLDGAGLIAVGRMPGQFVGHDYFELWKDHPDLTQAVAKGLTGEPSDVVILEFAGRVMETRCSPVRDTQGNITGVITVCVDVTERKQAEEALRLRQFALDNAVDSVFIFGPDSRFIYANDASSRSLGYDAEELLSLAVFDIDPGFTPDDSDRHWRGIRDHRRHTMESVHRRKDGSEFPVEVTVNYLNFEGKELVCAFARDITLSKQREEESQRLRNELAHVARLSTMGEMASGLAHEINQPLTAIANFADAAEHILRTDEPDSGRGLQELTAQIGRQAHRAGEIIRSLREFVKFSEPERTSVDVNRLIHDVVALVETEARLNGIRLNLNLSPGLPEILADRIQVQQVVLNLLRNAFDAVEEHPAGLKEVTIETAPDGESGVSIVVSDTGEGFPAKEAETIFDAFKSTKPEGMGMGLAISRSIVEAHGGRIWATSEVGVGATLHLTLVGIDEPANLS